MFLKNLLYHTCYGIRNILDPLFYFTEVAILGYHSISDESIDTAVSAEDLEKQILYLKQKGFVFVSLDNILSWTTGDISLHKAVAITFDDGYADFEMQALPLLEKYKIPATLFITGDTNASREKLQNEIPLLSAEAQKRVQENPLVTFGYHGMTHANVEKISGGELRAEITCPTEIDATRFFAYPGGHYSEEAVLAVEQAGYVGAVSIKRRLVKRHGNRYLLPRTIVTHSMRPWLVGVHVTKAIDWYRAITRILK